MAKVEQETQSEANRARVRRLLIEPLQALGFRFPKATTEADQKKALTRIIDDVAYLPDHKLIHLRDALRTKGEGARKCFWPARATFIAYAELAQPRSLAEVPGVASWFASAAGREAHLEGRLVEEYAFWKRWKRPPMNDREKRTIANEAKDNQAKARRIRDQIARRGSAPLDGADWLNWYDKMQSQILELVEAKSGGAEIVGRA